MEKLKQKKQDSFFNRNKFVMLSGACALAIMLLVFYCYDLIPFGDMTILRMDLYHQYGPLFAELYDRITSGGSLLYSWNSGLGSSFLGNFLNYLSSPLSLLVLVFGHENITEAISTLILLKAVLSACSFTYYLKSSIGKNNAATAAFGVLYAFCGYFVAYYWNVMSCNGKYTIDSLIDGFFMDTDNPNKEKYLGEDKEVIGKDCQNDVDDLITKPVANTPGNIMDARLKALDSVVTKEESELYAVKDNDNEVFNQIKVTPEVRNVIESSIKNTPEPKINEPRVVRGTADRNVVQKPITVKKDPSESIIMKSQVSSNIKDGQKKKTVKQQPDAIKYYPESDNNSGSSWGEGW